MARDNVPNIVLDDDEYGFKDFPLNTQWEELKLKNPLAPAQTEKEKKDSMNFPCVGVFRPRDTAKRKKCFRRACYLQVMQKVLHK